MAQTWFELLRVTREAAGLSRGDLAARSAVSEESIRAYESGRRNASRRSLDALLGGLAADPARHNEILRLAGFVPDGAWVGKQSDRPDYSLAEAMADIETYPWPAHINTEFFEVLGANRRMQELWGVDLAAMPSRVERNMMIGLSTPRWADRILNWDEAMAMCAAMLKGGYGEDVVGPDGPNPYLEAVVEHFFGGAPEYVGRFVKIWLETEPHVRKWRFAFPIRWQLDDGRQLRFRVSVNPVNFNDYMTISEWIPLDAPTWEALAAR